MTKIPSSMTLLLSNVKFSCELADVTCDRMTAHFKRIKEMCGLPGEAIRGVLLK